MSEADVKFTGVTQSTKYTGRVVGFDSYLNSFRLKVENQPSTTSVFVCFDHDDAYESIKSLMGKEVSISITTTVEPLESF
jgi:small nuclear ribonucleoprotein (snRNP)-like protein